MPIIDPKATKTSQRLRDLDRSAGRSVPLPPSLRGPEEEEPVVSAASFVMFSLLGFVVVLAAALIMGLRGIEQGLERAATGALRSNGLEDVRVSADGRDLDLTGSVPDESLISTATEIAAAVEGVREVQVDLRVVVPKSDVVTEIVGAPVIIRWSPGDVSIEGNVSDEATRAALLDYLDRTFPTPPFAGNLKVLEGMQDEDEWFTEVLQLVSRLADATTKGEITVNAAAGIVVAGAEFDTRQERKEVRDDAEEIVAGSGLVLVSGLTVKDAPPPPRREQVIELQANIDDLIEGKVVEFELNSDVITAAGKALLDEVLDALATFPDIPIEIAGHADAQGSSEANLELSERRARAVLAYLVDAGEDPDRFTVVGYGETRPIADNSTEEGRARNRRIEFIALEE